jgi:hypothetical protein
MEKEKKEISPAIIAASIVVLLGFLGGLFYFTTQPHLSLRAGVDYTPGKPPWMDPKYKGATVNAPPGQASPSQQVAAPPQ